MQELASRVSVLPSDCDAFEKAIYDVGMQGFATEPELLPLLKTLSGLKDLTIALDRRDPANQRLSLKDIISLKELRRLVLYVNEAELKDLDALGELPYLEELEIYTDTNLNLVHFRKLAGLRVLKLHQAGLQDVSPLAELKNLDVLELPYNLIDNLAPLTVLTGLMELNLDRNGLNDITPIKALTGLKKLSLRENNIGDASPLSALTNLTDLDLSYNRIADLKALSGLSLLQRLRVIANPMRYGCQMSDQTFSKSVCQF